MKFTAALLAAVAVGQEFRSGSVSTHEKFKYGKFVTRMKAPDRKGTVSSFFTYWDGPNFDPLEWNELDMEIVPSVEENPFSMNVVYGDGHDKVESHDYAHAFDPHDDWHTYEMEWTPHYISWLVDGNEVRHMNVHDPAVNHMDKAQALRMNFWTPTFDSWHAGFNPHDMPWYVMYDYVEVFTYDEEHNEFKFHWRDDFDSFDSGKWHKAAGGFESNTSTFHPENVYTSGGHLVLKMEPEHSHAEDLELKHSVKQAFEMDLDHRQEHASLHMPHMNEASFEEEEEEEYDEEPYYQHKHGRKHHSYHRHHQHGPHEILDREVISEDHRIGPVEPHHGHRHYSHQHHHHHQAYREEGDLEYDEHYELPARHEDPKYYEQSEPVYHTYYEDDQPHEEYYHHDHKFDDDSDTTDSEAEWEEYQAYHGKFTHHDDNHSDDMELVPIQVEHYVPQPVYEGEVRPVSDYEQHHYGKHYHGSPEIYGDEDWERYDDTQVPLDQKAQFKMQKKRDKMRRKQLKHQQKYGEPVDAHTIPEGDEYQSLQRSLPYETTEQQFLHETPATDFYRPITVQHRVDLHPQAKPAPKADPKPVEPARTAPKTTPGALQKTTPAAPQKPTSAPLTSPPTSDPSQMTYDQWRLQKHKQKLIKHRMKPGRHPVEQEPEFKTYAEFQDWKYQQKVAKQQQKTQLKQQKRYQKYHRFQAAADPFQPAQTTQAYTHGLPVHHNPAANDDSLFQHVEDTQTTTEKKQQMPKPESEPFQHKSTKLPAKETTQQGSSTVKTPADVDFHPMWKKGERQQAKKPAKTQTTPATPSAPKKAPKPTAEEKQTIHERAIAAKTHYFEGEQRKPDLHEGRFKIKPEKVPTRRAAEHEHAVDREIEKRYRRHSKIGHHQHSVDEHPKLDLFDFDDPMSDSDYDDADEDTGIYHDDEPESHPGQHIKHTYSDDQYYHSRERYFPEQSYHAAGSMKYDVETVGDLTKHALGKREKPKKKEPAAPAAPAAAPKEATTPAPAKPAQKLAPEKDEPSDVFQHKSKPVHPYQEKKPQSAPAADKPSVQEKPVATAKAISHETLGKIYHRWSPHFSETNPKAHHTYHRFRHEEERDGMDKALAEAAAKKDTADKGDDQKVFESAEEAIHKMIADEHKVSKAEEKKHKITPKQYDELRVSHGLASEREHSVDHTIQDMTRPAYEIRGNVDVRMHDSHHNYDRFTVDTEQEYYGDEMDERKPHLYLHPKKQQLQPRVVSAADETHFYAGEHSYHIDQKEVMPEGSDHWVEVHRDYDHIEHHPIGGRVIAPFHSRAQHYEPSLVKEPVHLHPREVVAHHVEPRRDYIYGLEPRHEVYEEPRYIVHEEPKHVVYQVPHQIVHEKPRHFVREEAHYVAHDEPRHIEHQRIVYERPVHHAQEHHDEAPHYKHYQEDAEVRHVYPAQSHHERKHKIDHSYTHHDVYGIFKDTHHTGYESEGHVFRDDAAHVVHEKKKPHITEYEEYHQYEEPRHFEQETHHYQERSHHEEEEPRHYIEEPRYHHVTYEEPHHVVYEEPHHHVSYDGPRYPIERQGEYPVERQFEHEVDFHQSGRDYHEVESLYHTMPHYQQLREVEAVSHEDPRYALYDEPHHVFHKRAAHVMYEEPSYHDVYEQEQPRHVVYDVQYDEPRHHVEIAHEAVYSEPREELKRAIVQEQPVVFHQPVVVQEQPMVVHQPITVHEPVTHAAVVHEAPKHHVHIEPTHAVHSVHHVPSSHHRIRQYTHEEPRHVVYEEPRHVMPYAEEHRRVVYEEPRHVVYEEPRHVVYTAKPHHVEYTYEEARPQHVTYEVEPHYVYHEDVTTDPYVHHAEPQQYTTEHRPAPSTHEFHDLPIEQWMKYDHGYQHQDDQYSQHYKQPHGYSDYQELPLHQVQFDAEHPGFHPELDHKYDEQHDIEPVYYHETEVLHAPDLSDHHSYHLQDFADYHQFPQVYHDHLPIYHSQYAWQHHDWKEPVSSTYYDVTTLKQHEKKPDVRIDIGMDLMSGKSGETAKQPHDGHAYWEPVPSKKSVKKSLQKAASSREVEYYVDSQGHVKQVKK